MALRIEFRRPLLSDEAETERTSSRDRGGVKIPRNGQDLFRSPTSTLADYSYRVRGHSRHLAVLNSISDLPASQKGL